MKQSASEPDFYTHFQIGPMRVAVRSIMPQATEDLSHLYQDFRMPDLAADEIDPQTTIRVDALPWKSKLPWRKRFAVHGDGKELFTCLRSNEILPYMEWAVNWRIIARGESFLQLHAATLEKNGAGLILAGGSGSGKSTLACGLMSRDWRYLCDEFALIDPLTHQLRAFPKALCVKEGSFPVVKKMGLPLWQRQHYAKAFKGRVAYVRPNVRSREVMDQPCTIRRIIFPRYVAASRPLLTPMARSEAAIELARMSFNRQSFGRRAINILSEICRHADCYRLESGDLGASCELIESIMPRQASVAA